MTKEYARALGCLTDWMHGLVAAANVAVGTDCSSMGRADSGTGNGQGAGPSNLFARGWDLTCRWTLSM